MRPLGAVGSPGKVTPGLSVSCLAPPCSIFVELIQIPTRAGVANLFSGLALNAPNIC